MNTSIENCILFKGLSKEQINELLLSVPFKEKYYRKNELIVKSDNEVKSLMIVAEGSVRGEMVDFNGKVIKIEDIQSPRMLAPAFLFGKNNQYPVDILANQDSTILVIPKDSFLSLLQENVKVLSNFLNSISNRAQFLSNKIKFLSFQTIKGKIAQYLLLLMQQKGSDSFMLSKSHTELSEMFGVARPSLSRALRELDFDGFINADGKNIKILNREKLMEYLKN